MSELPESKSDAKFINRLLDAQRGLTAYILSLAPSFADADDILQETNAALLRLQSQFDPETNFWSWASRVAYYEVLAFRKRRQRNRNAYGFDDDLLARISAESSRQCESLDAHLSVLGDCMKGLKEEDHQLVRLRYHGEMNASQIAGTVGRTVRAVYQALYRIRNDLAQCVRRKIAATE
jgi:RNA polymerase sigma-70 factor (ECF subfamily)